MYFGLLVDFRSLGLSGFFFFQAEDGIRDYKVTGVQTCALPILPQVDVPTIRISANLPGANAETMASSVAGPLERQLSLISGVTAISSTSSLSHTAIQVEFDLSRNIDAAAQDVQTAINA